MKKLVYAFIFCGLTLSCKQAEDKPLVYDSSDIEKAKAETLSTSEISTPERFANPQQMELVGDSLIVLFDNSAGTIGKVMTVAGTPKCAFGIRGKGRGEVMSPTNISVGTDGRSVYIYDYMAMASQKYVISPSADSVAFAKTIDFKKDDHQGFKRYNAVVHSSDADYIGFGYNDQCRIRSVQNGKIADNYTSYPHIEDNEEYNWSFWSNLSNYGVSPDGKHLVTTTGIGMLAETFSVKASGKIESESLSAFYKPVFKLAEGAKPACVIFDNDKTFGGFKTICLGNDRFWGVIYGKAPKFDAGNNIYEFDYNGKLQKKYRVEGDVACMAVSSQDVMYLITSDGKGNYRLSKTKLP